ncbi:MAG: CHASE sensor domain-containing protein, partial [Candidatus Latescibacteria bacterium]|nr:CHASE sensor domain-containing protein [Candidatus Latescibacterota bacterium]
MTIRKKLMAIQLLTAFAVLVIGSAVFVRNEIQAFQNNMIKSLSSTALLISENTASTLIFLDNQSAEQVLISLQVEPHITNACIYDAKGQIFATYNRRGNENFDFPTAVETGPIFRDDFLELYQKITRNQDQIGEAVVSQCQSQRGRGPKRVAGGR